MTHQVISKTDKKTSKTPQLITGTPGPLIHDGDHLGGSSASTGRTTRQHSDDSGCRRRHVDNARDRHRCLEQSRCRVAVDAPAPVEKRFAVCRVSVADSKLNERLDVLQGAPDLVCGLVCIQIFCRGTLSKHLCSRSGPHDPISEVFSWPGQSVGIRVVDRDLRNDDTPGSVVLPASAARPQHQNARADARQS